MLTRFCSGRVKFPVVVKFSLHRAAPQNCRLSSGISAYRANPSLLHRAYCKFIHHNTETSGSALPMLVSCWNMSDDMRFPHTADDWKIRKNMPKYWFMISWPFLFSFSACMFPLMVRYVHLADQSGEPPKPRMADVAIRLGLRTRHVWLKCHENEKRTENVGVFIEISNSKCNWTSVRSL